MPDNAWGGLLGRWLPEAEVEHFCLNQTAPRKVP